MSLRIEPIEKPGSLLLKIAYAMSKRMLGRVITPMKVLYTRVPPMARISYSLSQAVDKKLSLEPGLRLLVTAQTSAINGCGFCLDMKHAFAVQEGIGLEKLQALDRYRESDLFDERERAALDYTGMITRSRQVDDATFDTLKKHFDDTQIVELTFVNAVENYYNLTAIPLGIESDGLCAIALGKNAA